MKNFLKPVLLFLLVLTIYSCNKNESIDGGGTSGETNQEFEFGAQVNRDFMGVVKDQSNVAISNATINIGTKTTQTDAKGVFIIKDATVQERFAYIEVSKIGYLKGLKTVTPTQDVSQVNLVLLTENIQPLPLNNQIQLSNGAQVTFNGSFEDASGNAYSGVVNYSLNHIDPASPTIANEMPGMLLGKTITDDFEMLQTYGMLHVSLTDASGNALQIASGSTAEIRMPIPSVLSGAAPATIPLWSFDEAVGYWVEDGFATKTGSEYVGTVSHFSWWNCDINFPTEVLCLTVEDANGNPLANVNVDLSFPGNPFPGTGVSNALGEICGVVPTNQTITYTAYDDCGNTLSTNTIGPFTNATTWINETITIPNSPALQTITGNFLDCNGSPVIDGYVELSYGGYQTIQYIENGVFEISTLICNGSTSGFVEGLDYNNSQSTGVIPFIFSQPISNIGTIISCNTIDEYITYQVDNEPAVTTQQIMISAYNSNTSGFQVLADSETSFDEVNFEIDTTAIGSYSLTDVSAPLLVISEIDLNTNTTTTQNFEFIISNFGNPTEYIDVTFSGDFTDINGVTRSITGTIHVRRDT